MRKGKKKMREKGILYTHVFIVLKLSAPQKLSFTAWILGISPPQPPTSKGEKKWSRDLLRLTRAPSPCDL